MLVRTVSMYFYVESIAEEFSVCKHENRSLLCRKISLNMFVASKCNSKDGRIWNEYVVVYSCS